MNSQSPTRSKDCQVLCNEMEFISDLISFPSKSANAGLLKEIHAYSLGSYDIESGWNRATLTMNEKWYDIRWFVNKSQVIVADTETKEMKVYKDDVLVHSQYSEGIIDLDVDGRRWEGGIMNGVPYGYGVLYDRNGKKEYEGFMSQSQRVCVGFVYCNDNSMSYCGGFLNGEPNGYGILCYRNGVNVYHGL